jgi:hypothetical protein
MSRIKIWIPENTAQSSPPSTPLNFHVVLEGHFDVDLIDAKSGTVKNNWKFRNVITNQMMDAIGSQSLFGGGDINACLNRMRAGTGTAIPSGTDTNLQTAIGNFVTNTGGFLDELGFVSGSAPTGSFHFLRKTRLFDVGDVSGSLTELGWFTSNNFLMVRALIRDSVTGAPTTIVKTDQEQLRVRYDLRMLPPTVTSSYQLVIGTTTHSLTVYPNAVTGSSTSLSTWGFFLSNFGGASWNGGLARAYTFSSISFAGGPWDARRAINLFNRGVQDTGSFIIPYITGTYYREGTHSFAATNAAINAYPSGIVALGVSPNLSTFPSVPNDHNHAWIITVDPPIFKSDTQEFRLFTRFSWSRSGTRDF